MIAKGITKEDFGTRIRKAFAGKTEEAPIASAQTPVAAPTTTNTQTPSATAEEEGAPASSTQVTQSDLRRQEQEKQARLAAKGKAKQVDTPPDQAPTESTAASAKMTEWLEQQRQRKSEARRERERVMAQIEADKAERRAKREQEKALREQQASSDAAATPATTSPRRTTSKATTSNLQVRLLDGATIRKQFPAEASLETDVRPWIDSHLETKAPYTFKQILAPQPARAISIGEEHVNLRDLDLIPSATLVLQPVQTYSDAYDSNSGGLLSLPYNAVTGAYGMVSGTLSGAANWLRGGLFRPEDDEGGRTLAQAAQQQGSSESEQVDPSLGNERRAAPASRNNIRVRTLADQ